MTIDELLRRVEKLRSRPLMVLCKTPEGKEKVMCLEECHRTGSRYIHVAANDLDQLLSAALGGEYSTLNVQKSPTEKRAQSDISGTLKRHQIGSFGPPKKGDGCLPGKTWC